ncbi:MAG: hypothetical protein ACI8W8_004047, partial [Rhodothermales bacterium]
MPASSISRALSVLLLLLALPSTLAIIPDELLPKLSEEINGKVEAAVV